MADPELVPRDALRGLSVAISVSGSADLRRLGLSPDHCNFAVAEIARAVLLAGGSVLYGGRLFPDAGFTGILVDEVRRYSERRHSLVICLAESEHGGHAAERFDAVQKRLGGAARLVLLDREGRPIDRTRWSDRPGPDPTLPAAHALTTMRRYVTTHTDARVLVGGKLAGSTGRGPGVVEEAEMSVAAGQPLYVAGGFGGAAAAVARVLGRDDQEWAPPDFPRDVDDPRARDALHDLAGAARRHPSPDDGLTDDERRQLAASHRPGDIATFLVLGLARARARQKEI